MKPKILFMGTPEFAVASLRAGQQHIGETVLPANQEIVLDGIQGNAMELDLEIDPQLARWVQLNVLRSPQAEEQTSITFYNFDRKLSVWYQTPGVICLDGTRSLGSFPQRSPHTSHRTPEASMIRRIGSQPVAMR